MTNLSESRGRSIRRLLVGLTVVAAAWTVTTAVSTPLDGGTGAWSIVGAVVYIAVAATALFLPAAIAVQVVCGQALCVVALLSSDGQGALSLVPVVVGVLVTGELLAIVGRLQATPNRDPRPELWRAGAGAVLGGVAYGVALLFATLPGPPGLTATALAATGCVLLASLLTRTS